MADLKYVTVKGKRINYETVGKQLDKGYWRISTKSKLYELAKAKLGNQGHQAVWLHTAVCAMSKGKPPGQIGVGKGKWTVDHVDGDCRNNAASNLRWCEHSENTAKGNVTRHQ
jgi:hypothetical protein